MLKPTLTNNHVHLCRLDVSRGVNHYELFCALIGHPDSITMMLATYADYGYEVNTIDRDTYCDATSGDRGRVLVDDEKLLILCKIQVKTLS